MIVAPLCPTTTAPWRGERLLQHSPTTLFIPLHSMNSAASSLGQLLSSSAITSSTLGSLVDVHSKTSSSYLAPIEQTMGDGQPQSHKDKDNGELHVDGWYHPNRQMVRSATIANAATTSDSIMASPLSSRPHPNLSHTDPGASDSYIQPSASPQPSSSVKFPKPQASNSAFSSNLIPPTPPMAVTPGAAPNRPHSPKNDQRLSRPSLTSRLSSRAGGKRHASIGSLREIPFPTLPSASGTSTADSLTPSSSANVTHHSTPSASNTAEHATPGWNARLREMGIHLPGMGTPRTPKSPRSGSVSSGGATPRSPEEHRAASYFSFRRRGSSGNSVSPGKMRSSGATPPPPPPPPAPAPSSSKPPQRHQPRAMSHSPISEESTPPPSASSNKSRRANLSLDLGSMLTSRGSTASLPLVGHTPVQHLVQGEQRQWGENMGLPSAHGLGSIGLPIAPPPHVHTPPVHPPAYEYPFLPNHAPRKPLEVRVEEVPPGNGPMEAGSWVVSVR